MKKILATVIIGTFAIFPTVAAAQTSSASTNTALISALEELVRVLTQELQQILAQQQQQTQLQQQIATEYADHGAERYATEHLSYTAVSAILHWQLS